MNKKYIFLVFLSYIIIPTFAQFRPRSYIKYSTDTLDHDLIEELPQFHSYINWTKGEVVTEYNIPITYNDYNIGRNVANLTDKLKDQLAECSIRAITKVRISSAFLLNDYFQRDKNVRFSLLSILYALQIENSIIKNSIITGTLTYPLFGVNSISELFYKNIKRRTITNYLQKTTVDSSYYDTIIIDMVMFKQFNPSIMPQLLDRTGNIVYSMATVNPDILEKRGIVYFVNSLTDALNHPIRGEKVAYIMPVETSGVYASDIVLFDEDIEKLYAQQKTLNSLYNGNVIIIHSSDPVIDE